MFLSWESLGQSVRGHLASRDPGNLDLLVGDLLSKPMAANVDVFELGHKGWEIFEKQSYSLLIIAINRNFVPKVEPEILEEAIPPESFSRSM